MEATAEDMEDTTDEAATIKAIIIRSIGWIKGQIRFLYHVEMKSTRLRNTPIFTAVIGMIECRSLKQYETTIT